MGIKLIIAGSRSVDDRYYKELVYVFEKVLPENFADYVTEVVSGTARGADRLGERWAISRGIPVTRMPADWATHGKSAGPKRNLDMAYYADAAVVLWDGESNGARDMARRMRALNKPCYVHLVDVEPLPAPPERKGL